MTPAIFKEMFPQFVGKSDQYVQLYIDQAVLSVNAKVWLGKTELGIAYLTAHLLAMIDQAASGVAGSVTSEKVGDLSRNYSGLALQNANEYSLTNYGLEFLRLRKSIPISPMVL